MTRNHKIIDYEKINDEIIKEDEIKTLNDYEHSNDIALKLIEIVNRKLEEQSKLRKVKIERENKIYKSELVEELINRKNIIYKSWKNTGNIENKRELRSMNRLIAKEKEKYEHNKKKEEFTKCDSNPDKMWKIAKKQIYGNRNKHPERVMENENVIRGSKNVSNTMNRFFVSKVRKIREELNKRPKIDPMISYKKFVTKPENKMKIEQISMDNLNKIFKTVNKSNSTGYYNISMKTLMKLRRSIQDGLLLLINKTIETKIFPECLKVNKILPIKKNKLQDSDCNNWRPINLLSPLNKLIEKPWVMQIERHLIKNRLIENNHQGGVKGRSTSNCSP